MGQYTRWCFTLNNCDLNRDYEPVLSLPEFRIKRAIYGFEVAPTTGTKHLQGYVEYDRTRGLPWCKKVFPGAHWEAAKGNARSNYDYCSKDGEFKTLGEWESVLKTKPGAEKRKAISTVDVLRGLLTDKAEDFKCTGCYLSRKKAFDERIVELRQLRERNNRYERYSVCLLSDWQYNMLARLFKQSNRQITWVADVNGGIGKSFLAHFMEAVYQADLFDGISATNDIAWMLSPTPEIIVFDVTRSDQSHFSYQALEANKNGFVQSKKYMGIKRIFPPPLVIVFANFLPDRTKLSADRWDIHEIINDGVSKIDKTPKWDAKTLKAFKPPPSFPELDKEEEEIREKEQLSDPEASSLVRCESSEEQVL